MARPVEISSSLFPVCPWKQERPVRSYLTESPSSRLANARTAGDWMATEVSEFASGLDTLLGGQLYGRLKQSRRIHSQSLTRPSEL